MTPTAESEIIRQLNRIEASGTKRAEEQVAQGNRLTRIETTLGVMPSRCDSHGKQIAEMKEVVAPLRELPGRVKAVEDVQSKRTFLAAVIGGLATTAVLAGKWLIGQGNG